MNQNIAVAKNTAVNAASAASVSLFTTIGTAANTLNSGVAAIGRLAQAADIKSDEWLFGIQSEAAERRPLIQIEAALKVRTESGARFQAHLNAMKDPEFAKAFNYVDELIAASRQPVAQAA